MAFAAWSNVGAVCVCVCGCDCMGGFSYKTKLSHCQHGFFFLFLLKMSQNLIYSLSSECII